MERAQEEPFGRFPPGIDCVENSKVAGSENLAMWWIGDLSRCNALQVDTPLHYAVKSRSDAAFVDESTAPLGNRLTVHASEEGVRSGRDTGEGSCRGAEKTSSPDRRIIFVFRARREATMRSRAP